MRIDKSICEDCDMECWFFMNKKCHVSYVLCTQKPYLPKYPAFLEDTFYTCFQVSTHHIRHVGKEHRTTDFSERYGYGYCFTNGEPWRDIFQYRYDGWNPLKRYKAYRSRKMVDSFWKLLGECKDGPIGFPRNFACPYEMEHKIAEWSKEGQTG